MKTIALLTKLFSLATFIDKFVLGIYSMSLVLIFASFSTLTVAICKLTFFRTATKTREKKKEIIFSDYNILINIFTYLFTFCGFKSKWKRYFNPENLYLLDRWILNWLYGSNGCYLCYQIKRSIREKWHHGSGLKKSSISVHYPI